ncbi:MAG: SLC13 family permease [Promethearchaeota archaeon]
MLGILEGYIYNKEKLEIPDGNRVDILLNYDAWMFVVDKKKFYKSLLMLIITLFLVIFLPIFTSIYIDIIALSGGVLTIIIVMNKEFEKIWKKLDLELIFYLFCILFISEALEYTGLLDSVAEMLNMATGGDLLVAGILLLWMSGLLSSAINNAPITKILIPVVNGMSTAKNQNILFSSISLGTILGENLSTMGDNLVIITMTREHGYELEFSTFMRLGIIITLIQLISSRYLS